MSVDTPVANNPFDEAARDLSSQAFQERGETRRDRSLWRLFHHGGFQDDLYDVSLF